MPLPRLRRRRQHSSCATPGPGRSAPALHYAVLIALVQLARADPVAASTAGAVCGALVNYALNHRFTFASGKSHATALPRFALVAVAGIALNAR